MSELPKFFVQDVKVTAVPGIADGSKRFEGRVLVQDPSEVVDPYGTLKQVYKEQVADDPFQAVHGALQQAAREVDPATPQADLLSTGALRTLPSGGYRAEAHFKIGRNEVPSVGYHPTSEQAAQLDAVINGNQLLHLYTK